MRITDNRYHRDLRRYQLAMRLIQHEARTHTICEWTGLTDERVRRFFRTYGVAEAGHALLRHRGPAPRRLTSFTSTPAMRSESAAVGGLCHLLGVIPEPGAPESRRQLPSVPRGEHLCRAYEMFRAFVPDTDLSLEQVMLLARALNDGDQLDLGRCQYCQAAILVDRLGTTSRICEYCAGDQRPRANGARARRT